MTENTRRVDALGRSGCSVIPSYDQFSSWLDGHDLIDTDL